jgi:hypothetical protein
MNDLQQLFTDCQTDKGIDFHDFGRWYNSIFAPFRDDPVRVLEIGVYEGASLKALRQYFHHPETIVIGMDIDESCKQYDDHVIIIGDATDPETLQQVIEQYGPFDIVIDDGSHVNRDVIKSFQYLFPRGLKEDGVYIVEDLVCWRSSGHQRATHPDHLTFFMQYVTALQQADFHISTCSNPEKLQRTYGQFDPTRFVDTMTFGPGFVALTKKERKQWLG